MSKRKSTQNWIGGAVAAAPAILFIAIWLAVPHASAQETMLRNPFNDPILQITRGMPACPEPEVPVYSQQLLRQLDHERSQRGVSCWLAGRCRLHNGYLYDAEIIPRVKTAIDAKGGFEMTSIWVLGQRRRVWLRGCVQNEAQSRDLEALVLHLDDVEGVQNELMVGTQGTPEYQVRQDTGIPSH